MESPEHQIFVHFVVFEASQKMPTSISYQLAISSEHK